MNDLSRQAQLLGDRFAPAAIPGLVCAYRFREGYAPELIEAGMVEEALAAEDGWLWLHFALTDKLGRAHIAGLAQLPEAAKARLLATDEPLGIEQAEDSIFGVIADFERDLDKVTENVGRLRFALTERLVVSARRHPLRAIDEIRQSLHAGGTVAGAAALIEAIVDSFCDAVARSCAGMSDELDEVEDHIISDLVERERARVLPVRRMAVRLHRQLASLAPVMRSFEREEEDGGRSSLALDWGRLAARLESLDQDVLGVQDRAKLLQDEVAARLAEETNHSLKALSKITALLLPGSLVSGIFGMNVHGLPFLDAEHGFVVVMVVGIAATAGFYFLLRRTGA